MAIMTVRPATPTKLGDWCERTRRLSMVYIDVLQAVLFAGFLYWSSDSALASIDASATSQCQACHASQAHDWQQSHHAKAMQIPDRQTVLAPFAGEVATYDGLSARFSKAVEPGPVAKQDQTGAVKNTLVHSKKEGQPAYVITLEDAGRPEAGGVYPVRYTFGFSPLQQYLIEKEPGQMQVAPFAFDTQSERLGGQQWYHLDEKLGETRHPRLDWDQPLQSWNGMCADCHSTGVRRGFDPERNRFSTSFTGVAVECTACHVPHALASEPSEKFSDEPAGSMRGTAATREKVGDSLDGRWVLGSTDHIASWVGEARSEQPMEQCYACHALRAPLRDGIELGEPFLDQFKPELLRAPFYSETGQIEEEVFVYGSFEQSRMRAAGVQCIDCHDPHTANLRAEGDALCASCHQSDVYETPSHHAHPPSASVECVDCHMPGRMYMGVDFRRDHQFARPDPVLAKELGARDVCQDCHEDRFIAWQEIKKKAQETMLPGAQRVLIGGDVGGATTAEVADHHEARQLYWRLHGAQATARTDQRYFNVIADEKRSPLERASLIATRSQATIARWITLPAWQDLMQSPSALVMATALEKMSEVGRLPNEWIQEGCLHTLRVVRVAAAGLPGVAALPACSKAINEQATASTQIAWRAEGGLADAARAMVEGRRSEARDLLDRAIQQDPYAAGPYINQADIFRLEGDERASMAILDQGLSALPGNGMLLHSRSLSAVRAGDSNGALTFIRRARQADADQLEYLMIEVLLLERLGEPQEAIAVLDARWPSGNVPPAFRIIKERLSTQR